MRSFIYTPRLPKGYIIVQYSDVIMGTMASQITSLTIVYAIVYSGADQRKHQSSASLAFVREIHRLPMNFPHKWPVTRKMFPFGDVIIKWTSVVYTLCMMSRQPLPSINYDKITPPWIGGINLVSLSTLQSLIFISQRSNHDFPHIIWQLPCIMTWMICLVQGWYFDKSYNHATH